MFSLDPLIGFSTGLTTQLRRMGVIPKTGIKPAYGGSAVGSIPPSANGESYRRAELRLGDAARSGGGGGGGGNAGYSLASSVGQPGGGGGSPADRAYQQEKARVAQMT